jgi:hypothetical protein
MEEEGVEENHFVILKKAGRRRRYFVGVEGGGGVMGQEEVSLRIELLYKNAASISGTGADQP